MIKLKGHTIQTRAFLAFTALFILFTPIGTISHEYGHMAASELYGLEATLHYQSASHEKSRLEQILNDLYAKNKEAIINDEDYPDKEKFERYYKKYNRQNFWISAGGPIQTCLTGIIGLLMLYYRKARYKSELSKLDWLAVFLSLFWLREIFNLCTGFALYLLGMDLYYFGGDEYYMALLAELPPGTFALSLGIIGALVACYVVFVVIPKKYRLSFIVAGFVGSAIGFAGWMYWLGPILLP